MHVFTTNVFVHSECFSVDLAKLPLNVEFGIVRPTTDVSHTAQTLFGNLFSIACKTVTSQTQANPPDKKE